LLPQLWRQIQTIVPPNVPRRAPVAHNAQHIGAMMDIMARQPVLRPDAQCAHQTRPVRAETVLYFYVMWDITGRTPHVNNAHPPMGPKAQHRPPARPQSPHAIYRMERHFQTQPAPVIMTATVIIVNKHGTIS